jgi:membrane-bound metal-dependent hydrolase YbcI (DUF457 family)
MPSPVAHALVGVATHVGAAPRDRIAERRRAVVTVAAALAPDLDLVFKQFGLAVHQGASHGIGAAYIAGVTVWIFAAIRGWAGARGLGIAAALGWTSHIGLDLLNRDTHPPIGLMALWPFDDGFYKVPWPLFLDIGRTLEWRTLASNTVAVAWEVTVLAPLLVLVWRLRQRRAAA